MVLRPGGLLLAQARREASETMDFAVLRILRKTLLFEMVASPWDRILRPSKDLCL